MGTSATVIYNEVDKSIDDIRKIIKGSSSKPIPEKSPETEAPGKKLTEKQAEILKKRFEEKSSFADIALQLQLPEKDVHREFMFAYQLLQKQNRQLTPI